jgi:hypothetical protein
MNDAGLLMMAYDPDYDAYAPEAITQVLGGSSYSADGYYEDFLGALHTRAMTAPALRTATGGSAAPDWSTMVVDAKTIVGGDGDSSDEEDYYDERNRASDEDDSPSDDETRGGSEAHESRPLAHLNSPPPNAAVGGAFDLAALMVAVGGDATPDDRSESGDRSESDDGSDAPSQDDAPHYVLDNAPDDAPHYVLDNTPDDVLDDAPDDVLDDALDTDDPSMFSSLIVSH